MASGPAGSETAQHDDDVVVTGEAVALDLRPTPFVLAAAGAIIDVLLYLIGGLALVFLVLVPVSRGPLGQDSAASSAITLGLTVLVLVVAPIAVETLSHGKSLGRLAVGARIVRDDGGAIGFRHAAIRGLVAVLDFYLTLGGFAAIVGLLNGRSKRLGDILAGTYSQYERALGQPAPVYGVPLQLQEWAATADVARMPDRLGRRIAQFLRQAPKMTPATRVRLARQLAVEASPWVSPLPDSDPELFVAAVGAIRRDREFSALQLERRRLDTLDPTLSGLPHGFPDRG
ncbi:RDD family protein [Galbitalea soli]|uniref:RDD family protein n=1 Tax=Galbitalea soli TaxID=1268042 RepID=A0A7C9TPY1_9MICO|nr:RDD family protein [Galbitalea soli]NEM90835.1 RDD family protein [Galbitalea soli]NYJ31555.1 putative RDD family membrane protein YckC [Galbitalea soli]